MPAPVIFISAATVDLSEWREHLHKAFSRAGFRVLTQDESLRSAPGDVRRLLTETIEEADCVIHLSGMGYGSHASAPFPEEPSFQCSWTQFEYYYAHRLKKGVIACVCAPNLSAPHFVEKSDGPADLALKEQLQEAHRQRVSTGYFTGTPLESQFTDTATGKPLRTSNESVVSAGKLLEYVAAAVGTLHQYDREHCEKAQKELTELAAGLAELHAAFKHGREQDTAFQSEARASLDLITRQTAQAVASSDRNAHFIIDQVVFKMDERDEAQRARAATLPNPPALPNSFHVKQPPLRQSLWQRLFGWRDEAENRKRMIQIVRRSQIDGILHEAVRETNKIEVDWRLAPDAVIKHADLDDLIVSTGSVFAKIFERLLDKQVLILGDPGSGKSILLLQMAEVLLNAAQSTPTRPIPLVLNLASWAKSTLPLEEWIVEESHLSYLVPKRVIRDWCAKNMICPLLDGLDDVAVEQRRACMDAIGLWRLTHATRGMAVCSRTGDYEALKEKCDLPTAIKLQPLTDEQINPVLERDSMAGVRSLLAREPWFRDDLRTVLHLSFTAFAYADMDEPALRLPTEADQASQREARRKHLYDTYITRRFADTKIPATLPESKVRGFLGWLASKMQSHAHTRFHLENLQLDWLRTTLGRCAYAYMSQFAFAILILGPLLALACLLSIPVDNITNPTWRKLPYFIGFVALWSVDTGFLAGAITIFKEWLTQCSVDGWRKRLGQGFVIWLVISAVHSVIQGVLSRLLTQHFARAIVTLMDVPDMSSPGLPEAFQWIGDRPLLSHFDYISQHGMRSCIAFGAMILAMSAMPKRLLNSQVTAFAVSAFLFTFIHVLMGWWTVSTKLGDHIILIIYAIFFGVFAMFPAGYFGLLGTKVSVGATKWRISWRGMIGFGLPIFLVFLPLFAVGQYAGEGKIDITVVWIALSMAAMWGTIGGAIAGIRRSQGTLESGRLQAPTPNAGVNSAIHGAFWFAVITIATVVLCGVVFLMLGITETAGEASKPPTFAEHLMKFLALGVFLACLLSLFSGIDIPVKHFVLRLVLKVWDHVPLRLARFLAAGHERTLLRPAGGGFEFIHRSLRDHFADTDLTSRQMAAKSAKTPWLKRPIGLAVIALLMILPMVWHPLRMRVDKAELLKAQGCELRAQFKLLDAEGRDLRAKNRIKEAEEREIQAQNELQAAEEPFRQALKIQIARHGEAHSSVADLQAWLGFTLKLQGKYEAADEYLLPAVVNGRQAFAKSNRDFLNILQAYVLNAADLAYTTKEPKRFEAAEAGYRELIQRTKEHYILPCAVTIVPLKELINHLATQEKWPEAVSVSRELVALANQIRKPPHAERIMAARNLVYCLVNQSHLDEAHTLIRQAIREAHELNSDDAKVTADCYYWLSRIYTDLGLSNADKQTRLGTLAAELGSSVSDVQTNFAAHAGPFDVTVDQLMSDGQGPHIGIKVGDIIARYNGEGVTSVDHLNYLRSQARSQAIPMEFQRGQESVKLTAKPGRLGLLIRNAPRK